MIKTPSRTVNKNLFFSRLKLQGLTLQTLGKQLDPPISKVRVHQIVKAGASSARLHQIAKILGSNISTLFPKTTNQEDDRNVA